MSAPRSLCIAIPRLYATAPTSCNGPNRPHPVDVRCSFVIRVGVYRNFVRERSPHRRNKTRQANRPASRETMD